MTAAIEKALKALRADDLACEVVGKKGAGTLKFYGFAIDKHHTQFGDDPQFEDVAKLAEQYMELRRLFFWDNGYRIRKLNQAYFAFYGAYADTPGGAAGDDPVAAAVRALFDQSDSVADFIRTISWMSSFEELEGYLESE